jgi:drug/metabolite transporter (DMT)-like permease
MVKVLVKELILGFLFLVTGLYFFTSFELEIFKKWVVFSLVTTLLMMAGTVLVKILINIDFDMPGLALAGIILFSQIILLLLLFIFLEPEQTNHRIVAKAGTISYLVFLGIDIYWKVKWMFPPKERKRLFDKDNKDF